MRWVLLTSLALAMSAPAAAAQSLCRPTEVISACRERVEREIKPSAFKEEAKAAQSDVAKKTETGVAGLQGLSSSVKDFVPLLELTGLLGALQRDETTGAVSIALNTPFVTGSGKLTDDPALQLRAIVETSPKLFDKLKTLVPAAERDAVEKQLLASKSDANNVTLSASYNFTSKRLGRNFAAHTPLYDTLYQAALGSLEDHAARDAAILRKLIDAIGKDISMDNTFWADIPVDVRIAVEDIILDAAQSDLAMMAAFRAAVDGPGLNLFGQLVNNQPQLHVTAYRSYRDDLYGPDLISARVTYEMGLGNNLNTVFDSAGYAACAGKPDECLATFEARVKDASFEANIKAGSRLTAYVEFVHNEAYHFTHLEPALELVIDKGTAWAASLEYGRLFGVSDTGAADGRVDASVKWEVPAESAADRRFVASLTITRKLGEVSVPFGLVYANKTKFLTGVDKGLSANVGLKFNLFPGLK